MRAATSAAGGPVARCGHGLPKRRLGGRTLRFEDMAEYQPESYRWIALVCQWSPQHGLGGIGTMKSSGSELRLPPVTAVVLNWENADLTAKCVASLEQLDFPGLTVIIVDNGSKDGSADTLRRRFPHHTLLQNSVNLGYAKGNNVGIRRALQTGAEFVWLLNNDVECTSRTVLGELLDCFQGSTGIVSPWMYLQCGRDDIIFSFFPLGRCMSNLLLGIPMRVARYTIKHGFTGGELPFGYVSGASMLVKAVVFRVAGLLPEVYFFYGEDKEFCMRARRCGYSIRVVPTVSVLHLRGASSLTPSLSSDRFRSAERTFVERNYGTLKRLGYNIIRGPSDFAESFMRGLSKLIKGGRP